MRHFEVFEAGDRPGRKRVFLQLVAEVRLKGGECEFIGEAPFLRTDSTSRAETGPGMVTLDPPPPFDVQVILETVPFETDVLQAHAWILESSELAVRLVPAKNHPRWRGKLTIIYEVHSRLGALALAHSDSTPVL